MLLKKMYFLQLCLCVLMIGFCCAKKSSPEEFIKDQIEEQKKSKFKCKSTSLAYLQYLHKNSPSNVKLCTLKALKQTIQLDDNPSRTLWTYLSELYMEEKAKKNAQFCQKKAHKKSKAFIQSKSWYFIGPFPIGKAEVDGDPVQAFGFESVVNQRWNRSFELYSELVAGGKVKWKSIPIEQNGRVTVQPDVDWNNLVMSLQSVALTEWQGNIFLANFTQIESKTGKKTHHSHGSCMIQ